MLLVRDESTLVSNKKLVGVRRCLWGCEWHRAVILSFQMCHAEQAWGFSGLTLEGKMLLEGRDCFSQEKHPTEVSRV